MSQIDLPEGFFLGKLIPCPTCKKKASVWYAKLAVPGELRMSRMYACDDCYAKAFRTHRIVESVRV